MEGIASPSSPEIGVGVCHDGLDGDAAFGVVLNSVEMRLPAMSSISRTVKPVPRF